MVSLGVAIDARGAVEGANQTVQSTARIEQALDRFVGRIDAIEESIGRSYEEMGRDSTAAAERAAAAAQRWAISEENAAKRASAAIESNILTAQKLVEAVDRVSAKLDTLGSKSIRGPREIGTELGNTADKALKLNRAIETVGEVTQVGGRVRLLGEEIRSLGTSSGSASGAVAALGGILFDTAQIGEKTGGSMRAIGAALRANPILAAAGVFSLIASAMAIFGKETADTNSELSKQIQLQEELRRASTDLALQLQKDADLQRVGFEVDPRQSGLTRSRRITELASQLAGQQGFQSFDTLRDLTGLDEQRLRAFSRSINGPGDIATQQRLTGLTAFGPAYATDEVGLTNAAAREVLLRLAQNLRENAATIPPEIRGGSEYGPFLPPGGLNNPQAPSNLYPDVLTVSGGVGYGSAIGPMAGEESPFSRVARLNEIQDAERQLAEFNERLAQTRQLGVDVGNALGNSFFAFLQNANNARGVLVGLLQQLSAIAQQRIVSGFANSVGNLFGQTVTQQSSNPGFVGPPTAPGFQIDNN